MTMLITTVVADRAETMCARAAEALAQGSDMVELRLDSLLPGEEAHIGMFEKLAPGRWMATCRPVSEGGMSRVPIEHRVPRLLSAVRMGAGLIDFEYAEWNRSPLARTDLARGLSDLSVADHAPGVILSHHDFQRRPENLEALVHEMSSVPEVKGIKVAWMAENICCNFDAFEVMRRGSTHAAAICMGEAGLLSRVLAAKFGALASYCSFDADSAAAPGQLTLAEMHDRYRWPSIDEATELFGVIGCPVTHSVGPDVFNDAFARANMNAVYLPLLVGGRYEDFAAFMDACLSRDWLDARGFSVTLPHKVHALRYLADRVDPPADLIGAVNTIRIEDGEVWG
ncbi:MAG: type I 3-dehydroquinate dehydratase, partial [Phycisphaerae bacterium]